MKWLINQQSSNVKTQLRSTLILFHWILVLEVNCTSKWNVFSRFELHTSKHTGWCLCCFGCFAFDARYLLGHLLIYSSFKYTLVIDYNHLLQQMVNSRDRLGTDGSTLTRLLSPYLICQAVCRQSDAQTSLSHTRVEPRQDIELQIALEPF